MINTLFYVLKHFYLFFEILEDTLLKSYGLCISLKSSEFIGAIKLYEKRKKHPTEDITVLTKFIEICA